MRVFSRRRKHSYNDLWRIVYGGGHEGDKGLLRELSFRTNILSGWRDHADFLMETLKHNQTVIKQIRELHKPIYKYSWMEAEAGGEYCSTCKGQMYPCETIKALNGEQE